MTSTDKLQNASLFRRNVLLVVFGQEVGVLLVRRLLERMLFPQVRSEEGVGTTNSLERGLGKVTKGSGLATTGRVAILNTSHLKEFLWSWS